MITQRGDQGLSISLKCALGLLSCPGDALVRGLCWEPVVLVPAVSELELPQP